MSIANISNTITAPQKVEALTVNGGTNGTLTMADTGGFYVGSQAFLSDNTPTSRLCQITQILSGTQLRIRFLNESGINQPQYGTGSDASAFLVANSATLTMPSQIVYAETRSAQVTAENELKVDIGGSPSISTGQGAPNTVANAWPVKVTDGTDIALVSAAGSLQVDGAGVAGTPAGGVVSMQGVAGGTPVPIIGLVAHDAADTAGNQPVKIGGQARTTLPTAVADGDMVNSTFTKDGKQIVVLNGPREFKVSGYVTLTTTDETTLITAAASEYHDLVFVLVTNTSATAVRVDFRDDTAGTVIFSILASAGDTRGFALPMPLPQTAQNDNWTVQLSAAVTDVRIYGMAVKAV